MGRTFNSICDSIQDLLNQYLRQFRPIDGRVSTLNRNQLGKLMTDIGDWDKSVKNKKNFHGATESLWTLPARTGKYRKESKAMKARSACRVFSYLNPTAKMLSMCQEYCQYYGVDYIVGDVIFQTECVQRTKAGTATHQKYFRVSLLDLLLVQDSAKTIASYAAFGLVTPHFCNSFFDGNFFSYLLKGIEEAKNLNFPVIIKKFSSEASHLRIDLPRSQYKSCLANWQRFYGEQERLRHLIFIEIDKFRLEYIFRRTQHKIDCAFEKNEINSGNPDAVRVRQSKSKNSGSFYDPIVNLKSRIDVDIVAAFSSLLNLSKDDAFSEERQNAPIEAINLKVLKKIIASQHYRPENKMWNIDPSKNVILMPETTHFG